MSSAHEAYCGEKRWENVEDDKHCRIKEQLQQNARPNKVNLKANYYLKKEIVKLAVLSLTFDFRLYFVKFTNGTRANVKKMPKNIPPIRPAKFACHGNVLIPKRLAAINNNFINAKYGFLSCFQ